MKASAAATVAGCLRRQKEQKEIKFCGEYFVWEIGSYHPALLRRSRERMWEREGMDEMRREERRY